MVSPDLTARTVGNKKWPKASLAWSAPSGQSVTVTRNGRAIAQTTGGSSYTDQLSAGTTNTYQACATGTTTCSRQITVTA